MMLINVPLLDQLVSELGTLQDQADADSRRADLHYTLCVATGIREPEQALARARCLLASHRGNPLVSAA